MGKSQCPSSLHGGHLDASHRFSVFVQVSLPNLINEAERSCGGNGDEPGQLGDVQQTASSREDKPRRCSPGKRAHGPVFLYRNQSDYHRKEEKKRWKQGVLCKASVCLECADVVGRDRRGHLESASSLRCCVADRGIIQHRK